MALRRGDVIRAFASIFVVTMVWVAGGWSAEGPSPSTRFVRDEIIVKFRTPVPDPNEAVVGSLSGKSNLQRDLRTPGSGFRVREIRPIVRDFDRRQAAMRLLRDLDPSRVTQKEKQLLRRQKRATATTGHLGLGNIYRIRLDVEAGASLEAALAAYRSRPDVEYAERNPIVSICAVPNDRLYADQWALSKIHAAEAWDTCRGSSEVIVAVIDTGVDYNHPDLQGNLWINEAEGKGLLGIDDDGNGYVDDIHGFNFAYGDNNPIDDHGHGTHVAGTIAAVGNNGIDIAGVCWAARIMPVKILDAKGEGSAADAVPAIYYAVANGADIISGSWGGAETSNALRDAIAYAHDQGVIVVAAAGNNASGSPYFPAAYPEVIAVAATDASDHRWYLSNYGDWVDIAAPGQNVISLLATVPGKPIREGVISTRSGTSMSAPHVSGACALLLAANPLLRCDELPQILAATGDPIQAGTCASNARLNVANALRAVIPSEGTIRMDRAYYSEGADIGLLLADWHLRGAGHGAVLVETSGGDKETVELRETNVSLGVLRGSLVSQNAVVKVGDGVLQVHDGEGIQARYLNVDANSSPAGQWRSASAVADYQPPTVVSLDIKLQSAAVTIDLRTSEATRAEIRYCTAQGGPYGSVQKGLGASESHSIQLSELTAPTQYWFVVAITDEAGNTTVADSNRQGYSFVSQRTVP